MVGVCGGKNDKICDGLKQIRKMDNELKKSFHNFNDKEIAKFRTINKKLTVYEKVIHQEIDKLYAYALKRVENVKDDVADFDIEIKLYFYLSQKDPAFDNDSDNIICILTGSIYRKSNWEWGMNDGKCHNTLPAREGTPMENDYHCYTFHALYDHTCLEYSEILRIGSFNLELKLHLKYDSV